MRSTFFVVGWKASVHDIRFFNDAISKYGDKFSYPPPGALIYISCRFICIPKDCIWDLIFSYLILEKNYLVDSGYPNRLGYLAPYRGGRSTICLNFPKVQDQVVNGSISIIYIPCSVTSSSTLLVLWRWWSGGFFWTYLVILLQKQTKIILSCVALHNFIR